MLKNLTKLFVAFLVAALTLGSSTMSYATAVPLPGTPEQTGSLSPSGFVTDVSTVEWSGDYVWTATATARKVFKVRKSTGAVEQEFSLPADSTGRITRSSIDANYLWLNHTSLVGGVTRVKLSDGTSEYFSLGSARTNDIASDGEFVWVTTDGVGAAGKVFKLSATTGAVLSETTISYPRSIDTDGENVWVFYFDGSGSAWSITKLNRSTGAVLLPGILAGLTGNPTGLRISGESVFVFADRTQIFERSVSDGSLISEISFLGDNLSAIEVSGGTLWSFSSNNSKGRQYDLVSRTGANPTYDGDFEHIGSGIRNATFDGLNLWAADISGDLIKRSASAKSLTGPVTPEPTPPATTPASTTPPVLATTGSDSVASSLALAVSFAASGSALLLWRRSLKKSLPVRC